MASTETLENARKFVERKNLTFPIAYRLDARAFATSTGAFFDDAKGYIHATDLILRPDGRVDKAVYSTGPTGRFVSADTLFLIDYRIKKTSQSVKDSG